MIPRFKVNCRPGPSGWLGSVEFDGGEHAVAIGASKSDVLNTLRRAVMQRTGLSPPSFELFEAASDRAGKARNTGRSASVYPLRARPNPKSSTVPNGPAGAPREAWFATLVSTLFRHRSPIAR